MVLWLAVLLADSVLGACRWRLCWCQAVKLKYMAAAIADLERKWVLRLA